MFNDYLVHVVSRETMDRTKLGQLYAGGILIEGTCCQVTNRCLLITYHGPEGEAKPLSPKPPVGGTDFAKEAFDVVG